jgi:hypothetical protein
VCFCFLGWGIDAGYHIHVSIARSWEFLLKLYIHYGIIRGVHTWLVWQEYVVIPIIQQSLFRTPLFLLNLAFCVVQHVVVKLVTKSQSHSQVGVGCRAVIKPLLAMGKVEVDMKENLYRLWP